MNTKVKILIAVIISVIVTSGVAYLVGLNQPMQVVQINPPEIIYVNKTSSDLLGNTNDIKSISSQEELVKILEASAPIDDLSLLSQRWMLQAEVGVFQSMWARDSTSLSLNSAEVKYTDRQDSGVDYSSTNIQVENVDEPDYIKNDGRYVYIVMKNTLSIIDAYPAEGAELILKVALDVDSGHIENIFLNGDRLLIFYNGESEMEEIPEFDYIPRRIGIPVTHALIIDVSDKQRPEILTNYSIDGIFSDARMIGDHAYFVTSSYIDYLHPRLPIILKDSAPVTASKAFYFDNAERHSTFVTLTAVDMLGDSVNSETYMMGDTGTFYVSDDNFYITYQQHVPFDFYTDAKDKFFDVIVPLLPDQVQVEIMSVWDDETLDSKKQWVQISKLMQESYAAMGEERADRLHDRIDDAVDEYEEAQEAEESAKTIIHKIAIDEGAMEYVAMGSVPGRLLNQFSMDESGDRFRVATTTEYYTQIDGFFQANAVYILDEQMNTVGGLDRIAPDESIFSARFIDDRLYLVTFEQIDPFFVIDLSTDTPKILGELKIPGFSNYLHPFDDDHIIGIGRDTKVTDGGRVQQLGVKIALFNVEDVKNPLVADEIIIGDASTHSKALHDHKAFFFDGSRGIISIPITGSEELRDISMPFEREWGGFYVLDVSEDSGFDLKGTIEHSENSMYLPRTFYIEDVLYTISYDHLKMNSFDGLEEINSISLQNTGKFIMYATR